jgi:RHS repeat-associated protein
MQWDFMERLSHITRGTTETYYNYDNNGERTRKVVEKNGITETRLYLGGFEIWRKHVNGNLDSERETLHIMDNFENNETAGLENNTQRITNNKRRVAIVETKTWENCTQIANPIPVQRYQLSNNIESAMLEIDENADIISYEEYYPYGETSYQAGRSVSEVNQKRYRYTSKEKDEESGLYYHGARYYACWLGRWTTVDPARLVDGTNLYMYCRGNPTIFLDGDGKQISNVNEVQESQNKLYHGISKEKALEGFKPKGSNEKPIVDDKGNQCGVKGKDFGVGNIGGRNCQFIIPEKKMTALHASEPNKETDGISIRYKGEAIFEINVINKIYYVVKGDKIKGREKSITEADSEGVYLHEYGHMLDVWSVVPEGGLTISIQVYETFCGKNKEAITKKATKWFNKEVRKWVNEEIKSYKEKIIDLEEKYHNEKAGHIGNPWDGKK